MNDVLLKKWMQQVKEKSGSATMGDAAPTLNGAAAAVAATASVGETQDAATRRRVRLSRETRAQMLDRLTNPTISLHEASVLLDVCPATVRRYTNQGALAHERTCGGQRRFRLRPVLALMRELERKRKGS